MYYVKMYCISKRSGLKYAVICDHIIILYIYVLINRCKTKQVTQKYSNSTENLIVTLQK